MKIWPAFLLNATLATALWAAAFALPALGAERRALQYKMPPIRAETQIRQSAGWKTLDLAIGLPLRNQAELDRFLQELNDPASPNYHHYLSPEQFTERFGPSEQDYEKVVQFARAHHLLIRARHPNRMVLDVKGMTHEIERTFSVKLRVYQHPTETRTFYAPDTAPTIEPDMPILTVSGLDNFVVPRSMNLKHLAPRPQGTGSGPSGTLMGFDFRAAYVPGVTLTGTGQTVGLLEFDSGFILSDITRYESLAGLPNVPVQAVLLDGYNGGPGNGNDEVSLDIEMAISMAPGLSAVLVYEGSYTDDILNRMATDNQAKQIGASWTYGIDATSEQIFKEFIAQGQSFYNASGDSDAYTGSVPTPSDDTNIVCVGGTTLTTSGPRGYWVSETVWNWGNGAGSSGGISTINRIPVWQQGINMTANQGSTTMRNLPDVAMPADNIYVTYGGGLSGSFGGTSCATPLWAAFTALANQLALANGLPTVGFINPAVYAMGKGSNSLSYTSLFHDITTGNNESSTSPTKFSAVPGYDLCTGWGTPFGSNLLTALAIPEPLRIAPSPGVILSGPAGGPFVPALAGFSLTGASLSSFNWSLLSTSSWFTASPTSGTLTHGGPAATITITPTIIASNLPPGSFTATLLFSNLNDLFVQTRQVTIAVVTPPLITSQPTNQPVLWGAPASFTVATAPDALLFYQWQLNGTNLTDGGTLSGSLSSNLLISAVAPTNTGSYSVIVSNVAGVQVSSNALLTIVSSAPVITLQPTNQNVLPLAPASFSVAAVGNPPFSYHWQFNGTNLGNGNGFSGVTTSLLSLNDAWPYNAGTYSVLISNSLGSMTSTGAVLSLISVTAPGVTYSPTYFFPAVNAAGDAPYAPLASGKDGRLYGTTLQGGASGYGTIFEITTNGAFAPLGALNYAFGGILYAGLVQGIDSMLYGVAFEGGTAGDGTVFRLNTNGSSFATLFSFNGNNGEFPVGGLIQANDGNFYGTTLEGGPYGYGTVFKITSGGARTTLISFDDTDGAFPSCVLVQGSDGNFYGTTENGGTKGGAGTVFKITPSGNLTTLYSFSGTNDGASPIPGLAQGTDGNFYGTTLDGGTNNAGTVFKITPSGLFTSLYSFTGTNDGANPWGGLLQSSDGNLYGTTEAGGAYGNGTVFRLGPDGDLSTIAAFDGYAGGMPAAALTMGTDGNLYGTASAGGTGGRGAIYQIVISGPLQITGQPQDQSVFLGGTARFSVATAGSAPVTYQWQQNGANLVDGGNIYGSQTATLAISNVAFANADLYSVVVSNAFGAVASDDAFLEVLVSPPQIVTQPVSQTVVAGQTATITAQVLGDLPLYFQWLWNGNPLTDTPQISGSASTTLTIVNAGATNNGLYSLLVSNAIASTSSRSVSLNVVPVSLPGTGLRAVHLFNDSSDGAFPFSALMQAFDGYLYGTSANGGAQYLGSVFRLSLSGSLSGLYSFKGGSDGIAPYAGLIQALSGMLYGTTLEGGANGYGTIFRMVPGGADVELHDFLDGVDGAYPYAPLLLASDGNLYGTASQGGTNGFGSVFRVTTNGVFTSLYSFTGGNDGSYPFAALVQGTDGNLYGTASEGGASSNGTVFAITTQGNLVRSIPLDATTGSSPQGGLVQMPDGSFFGTAIAGGLYGYGSIFKLDTNDVLTAVLSFNYTNGANPAAALILGSDGNLYGTTASGGVGHFGTVFRLTPNGVLTTLALFDGLNGASPEAPLVQATSGNFYGTTTYGGTGFNGTALSGQGTIFELTVPIFDSNPLAMPIAVAGLVYSGSIAGSANSLPGDVLTFAKISGPAWLTVAPNGALSGTPGTSDIGTNVFVVTLTNSIGLSANATMLVPVHAPAPPTFVSNPFTAPPVNESQPVSASIAAVAINSNPGDALQFALLSGPAWLGISTNGLLSGTPSLSDVGTNTFLVSVTDLLGLSATATMYLQVYGPPAFVANPFAAPFAGVGHPYSASFAGSVSDPNPGNSLSFALLGGPAWLTASNNGALSGTPGSTNAGTNSFLVSATDSGGLSAQATMGIYVYTPPSWLLKPFAAPRAIVGVPYQATIATNAAPDPDVVVGDTLSFRRTTGPSWLNVATNGQLSGSPSASDVGAGLYLVYVQDSVGFNAGTRLTITVTTDSPPSFLVSPFTLPDARSGVPYTGTIATNATDPDLPFGDSLSFAKLSGPVWLTVSNDGTFAGTPGCADSGTNVFFVSVRDYDGLSNNATMTIRVEGCPAFNTNAVFAPWANLDEAYSSSIAASAVDPVPGASLLFGKLTGPPWLTVSTNGAISGMPDLSNVGSNIFLVSVTDYRGLTNSASLYVYVNSPPEFNPNPFTKPQAYATFPYTGSVASNVTDPDLVAGDSLTFYKVTGPAWLSVSPSGALSGTPANADIGSASFLVLCVDSGGLSAVGTMNITVAPASAAGPIRLAISMHGNQIALTWSGGIAPFQLQTSPNLSTALWTNLGAPTTTTNLLLSPTNSVAWFRIKGQ